MPTLFDLSPGTTPAPTNGTATSALAGERVVSTGKAETDRSKITVYLFNKRDGATRHELAEVLGISPDSVRPRVAELLGHHRAYLDRGGEAVLVPLVVDGQPVRRSWGSHGPSEVLVHRCWKQGR